MTEERLRICEQFQLIRSKGEKIFLRLRALPPVGAYWEPFFEKAFNTYSKLWKLQQQHRAVLETTPTLALKRWEIGELAARIAQLYYHYYLRTSDTSYLQEAFTFYAAIRSRGYFATADQQPQQAQQALSARQAAQRLGVVLMRNMRYHARFLLVCLFFGAGNELLDGIIADMSLLVVRLKTECSPTRGESQQWQALLEEVKSFQAHRVPVALREPSGKIVPFLDPGRVARTQQAQQQQQQPAEEVEPLAPPQGDGRFRLHAAVVAANKHGQIKFSELTLDMLRMMHSLEYDLQPPLQQQQQRQEEAAAEAAQHRNPQKYLLYQGSVTQLQNHLASLNSQLPQNRAVMLYVSADAAFDQQDSPQHHPQQQQPPATSLLTAQLAASPAQQTATPPQGPPRGLRMAPDAGRRQNAASTTLSPADIVAFTRMPMLLVIESDNATPFTQGMKLPHNEPFLCLASPQRCEVKEPGLFTLFLHAPLAAFCVLCGIRTPDRQTFNQCNSLLREHIDRVADILTSLSPAPSFVRFMEDDFMRLFICRFVFCHATLSQFVPSNAKGEAWLPASNPVIPASVLNHRDVLPVVHRIASLLGVSALFGQPQPQQQPSVSSPSAPRPVKAQQQQQQQQAAGAVPPPRSSPALADRQQQQQQQQQRIASPAPGVPPPLPPPPSPVIGATGRQEAPPPPPPPSAL